MTIIVPPGPKVLIRTLPLRRGNYGGILQAFALQEAVRNLGYSPYTDLSEAVPPSAYLRRIVGQMLSAVASRPVGYHAAERLANREIMAFIENNMSTTSLYRFGRWARRSGDDYHAVIVGSDQVWRPQYGNMGSYLLDFLPETSRTLRVAYAASFGAPEESIAAPRFARLAKSFDAVSVREGEAVSICEDIWGIRAERMPDPTLLCDPSTYSRMSSRGAEIPSRHGILAYVLDHSVELNSVIAATSAGMDLPTWKLGATDWSQRESGVQQRPAVGMWLRSIQSAPYVVTDSFHGTIFSIIFHRPFVAFSNSARGNSRFHTLLNVFGLEDRLIARSPGDDVSATARRAVELLREPIDWDRTDAIRTEEKSRGIHYLERHLRRPSS